MNQKEVEMNHFPAEQFLLRRFTILEDITQSR